MRISDWSSDVCSSDLFILSGEIMAIALGTVATEPIWEQAIILVVVAFLITAGVYGVVGFIVKMDDTGLHLAERRSAGARMLGRAMAKAIPVLMGLFRVVGTAGRRRRASGRGRVGQQG